MKRLLVCLLFFSVIGTAVAQTTGQLSYALDFASDDPTMAMAIPMMQGSTMELYFVPEKSKINMSMGMMMNMTTVTDVKADKGLMLMEVMGRKTATELKISEMNKPEEKSKEPKVEATAETKTIIGYKCTKSIVRSAEGQEIIMWVTPDLKAALKGLKQFASSSMNGIPLEFSTVTNGITIHFVATQFEKNVDPGIFSLAIPEGYQITSQEELKKMGM